ncbi:MAG: hypothetical protein IJO98_03075 [Clostridia bacterium]|nr:hypothetical protein [Clostridia bacterium]
MESPFAAALLAGGCVSVLAVIGASRQSLRLQRAYCSSSEKKVRIQAATTAAKIPGQWELCSGGRRKVLPQDRSAGAIKSGSN